MLDTVQKDHVGKDGKYKTIAEMILSYVLHERVNRLAINDILVKLTLNKKLFAGENFINKLSLEMIHAC